MVNHWIGQRDKIYLDLMPKWSNTKDRSMCLSKIILALNNIFNPLLTAFTTTSQDFFPLFIYFSLLPSCILSIISFSQFVEIISWLHPNIDIFTLLFTITKPFD